MEQENHNFAWRFSITFVIVVTVVVWYAFFGYAILRDPMSKIYNGIFGQAEAEPVLLDISSIEEADDAILNKSTKEFIGNYTVDESFLGWFAAKYGADTLEEIASYAELSNPDIWYDLTGSSIHVLWYNYCLDTGYNLSSFDRTYLKETKSSYETVLDFTGDFSLAENTGVGTYYTENVENGISDFFGESLINEMTTADILTINNETTYTTRGTALTGKPYTFRTNPDFCSELVTLGVDVAGLANNHVYDFGEIGLLDTMDTLTLNGIPYVGAGNNLDQAEEPVYFIANGKKIAIVAATQIERYYNYTKEATATSAGVLKTKDPANYVYAIQQAKENADYVICFVHWGTEGTNYYEADQTELANAFIAAGADAIIGGHTHCLQGIDIIDDVPVFYSLGNFYFTEKTSMPADYDTAIAQLVIKSDGTIEPRLLPCVFSKGTLQMVTSGSDYERILNDVESYSANISIDDDGYVSIKK